MTAETRRRVIACAVTLALALPAESILLQAIATPSTTTAVRAWAESLSADDLLDAGDAIQSYPVLYRKEIMRASSPDRRAEIWRNHIQSYLDTNPNIRSDAVPVLQAALRLITPEIFSKSGDKQRKATALIADQVTTILGRAEAEYLFYRLGPRDEQTASIEPLGMRLTNYVRGMLVALANAESCDCSPDWGCEYGGSCRTSVSCTVDNDWPACGWLWNEECSGLCGAGGAILP